MSPDADGLGTRKRRSYKSLLFERKTLVPVSYAVTHGRRKRNGRPVVTAVVKTKKRARVKWGN